MRTIEIITESCASMLFCDELIKLLIGVLKSPYYNIAKAEEFEKKMNSMGQHYDVLKVFNK